MAVEDYPYPEVVIRRLVPVSHILEVGGASLVGFEFPSESEVDGFTPDLDSNAFRLATARVDKVEASSASSVSDVSGEEGWGTASSNNEVGDCGELGSAIEVLEFVSWMDTAAAAFLPIFPFGVLSVVSHFPVVSSSGVSRSISIWWGNSSSFEV